MIRSEDILSKEKSLSQSVHTQTTFKIIGQFLQLQAYDATTAQMSDKIYSVSKKRIHNSKLVQIDTILVQEKILHDSELATVCLSQNTCTERCTRKDSI